MLLLQIPCHNAVKPHREPISDLTFSAAFSPLGIPCVMALFSVYHALYTVMEAGHLACSVRRLLSDVSFFWFVGKW